MNEQNFNSIIVYKSQDIIERAFKKLRKFRQKRVGVKKKKSFERRESYDEKQEIMIFKESVVNDLNNIVKSLPTIENLNDFYKELINEKIGIVNIKKSLAALSWASKKISEVSKKYSEKKGFIGRTSSLLKRISKDLDFLEFVRKEFKEFPRVKDLFTIIITGFPNVGKTTLLYKLTGSKPEIKNYAFTTKQLNIGYLRINGFEVQIIDTPGTLNRAEKMNVYEKQSFLAIKHLADIIVFVIAYDYELKKQIKLLNRILSFKKPTLIFLNKVEISDENFVKDCFVNLEEFSKKTGLKLEIFTDTDLLKKELEKGFFESRKK
ncbi:MAG: GTPase [Candidatus Woesearchaeota archaeon]